MITMSEEITMINGIECYPLQAAARVMGISDTGLVKLLQRNGMSRLKLPGRRMTYVKKSDIEILQRGEEI
jgi:hypothetical protein